MTRSATQNPIWSHIQRGLVYPSPHAIYAIFFRGGRKPLTKKILRELMRELRGIRIRLGNPADYLGL